MSQQFIIKLNEQGPQGARGEDGATGPTGNGINNISKTSTSGIVDTYTILYTDGNTSTFTITNGNSIDTIEKTDTVGLVDTYTITMVDGSTHTFEVTNGSSISNISKTSTVGLVDTYTITLTNGDTSTFTVTNGNGISTISKTATSGLTDTYTISFTNGNTTTFDVENGKSITSITGPVSIGLVDTYTINFNDSTSTTFTVTNGEKGDTGDTGATGNGISNIAKTSTSGLEDTYTITYTNGTATTFKVINGNGISSIEKLSSTGLTDNFRINFTNGTYFDYSLDNAKSIVSIAKTFTSGLVDTYTITYNDNTTSTFLVTNGRGVSGVTLLSYVGLEKTYRMSFNDGTYFDYVVTNGTGQVDWGGISGVLSQQADLQEVLDSKANMSQTHALKAYSDNGELLTDAEGLANVKNYAHSTFDKSKFTVVGSPNITDDGIASGFSSSNYLKVLGLSSVSNNNTFVIKGSFKTPGTFSGAPVILSNNSNSPTGSIFFQASAVAGNKFQVEIVGYPSLKVATTTNFITANTQYDFIYEYNSGVKLKIKEHSATTYTEFNSSVDDTFSINFEWWIGALSWSAANFNASGFEFDLKQFSITVDGVEVFSGNKTGIDTIKPDDYTVVGTPTISADGIASGFSDSNYLTQNLSISNATDFELISPVFYNILSSNRETVIMTPNTGTLTHLNIWSYANGTNALVVINQDDNGTHRELVREAFQMTSGVGYQVKIVLKNNLWDIYYKTTQNLEWVRLTTTSVTATDTVTINNLYLGKDIITSNAYCRGSIDLNAFKIYVDGNLVYQPCLKIPYTKGSEQYGGKYVNAQYLPRVKDAYEQGLANDYFTLDEANGTYTLPMGNLYGMIGGKTLRDSYYNGVTYWELFSNRRLEQGGTCESGVEYTFPKPFADRNYVLTIPYSSKTETSFIPSATGDFIAKGRGLL